jgi:hypothetical protein
MGTRILNAVAFSQGMITRHHDELPVDPHAGVIVDVEATPALGVQEVEATRR